MCQHRKIKFIKKHNIKNGNGIIPKSHRLFIKNKSRHNPIRTLRLSWKQATNYKIANSLKKLRKDNEIIKFHNQGWRDNEIDFCQENWDQRVNAQFGRKG